MTTDEQIAANQANAKKSTGPRTEEGKANSKMNAVTHGLLSQYTVMSGEDADQFEALRTMLCEEFKPVGGYEETLVDDLAGHYWRLARLLRIERNILTLARCEIRHRIAKSKATEAELQAIGLDDPLKTSDLSPTCKDLKDKAQAVKAKVEQLEVSFGGAFLHNVKNGDALSRLARHETRIRNEIRKIVTELEVRLEKRSTTKSVKSNGSGKALSGALVCPDPLEDGGNTNTASGVPV